MSVVKRFLLVWVSLQVLLIVACDQVDQRYAVERSVHYTYRIHNPTGRAVDNASLEVFSINKGHSSQKVIDLTVSDNMSKKHRVITDEHGNESFYYNLGTIPPGYTAAVTVKAELGYLESPLRIDETESNLYLYTHDAENALVASLKMLKVNEKRSVYDMAVSAYEILSDRESLKAQANEAEKNKFPGTPDSKLNLLGKVVYFLRLNNIPARAVVGFHGESDKKVNNLDVWLEYYEEDSWKVFSVSKSTFSNEIYNYIVLQIIPRVVDLAHNNLQTLLYKGYGLEVGIQ